MTTAATGTPASRLSLPVHPNFSDNGRRARYGAAYFSSLCAHAGATFNETRVDEDIEAVDGTLGFQRTIVRVQIKCTSKFVVGNGQMTLPLDSHWVDSWEASDTPVFVVVVKVPKDVDGWVEHDAVFTRHHTVAFGKRFPRGVDTMSLTFTAADKLTSESIYDWRDLVYDIMDGRTT
jgi:hypothetical protein